MGIVSSFFDISLCTVRTQEFDTVSLGISLILLAWKERRRKNFSRFAMRYRVREGESHLLLRDLVTFGSCVKMQLPNLARTSVQLETAYCSMVQEKRSNMRRPNREGNPKEEEKIQRPAIPNFGPGKKNPFYCHETYIRERNQAKCRRATQQQKQTFGQCL